MTDTNRTDPPGARLITAADFAWNQWQRRSST